IRRQSQDYATEMLGAEVDIGGLQVSLRQSRVVVTGLQVADPYNLNRNLLSAGRIILDLDPTPLLEKKLVIDQMEMTGLQFLVPRAKPARAIKTPGIAQRVKAQLGDWKQQFNVPLLSLTPVDTIKALVLDPTKLASVQAALAVKSRADSIRQALEASIAAVKPGPVLDSAKALTARLGAANPTKLGTQGTLQAVADIKRTLDQVKRLKQQVAGLQQSVTDGAGTLTSGLKDIDAARQQDYQLARSLLKLPSVSAPDISYLLFGPPTASIFEQALYYTTLGRSYLPPGLDPLRNPGPKRLRMAGTTIAFPKLKAYPTFLLRQGKVGFQFGGDTTGGAFTAAVEGLTSEPALYGRPTVFTAQGSVKGTTPLTLQLGGLLNHVKAVPLDSVQAAVGGLPLPAFNLPGLPFRLDPGRGHATLQFALEGDRLRGHWGVASNHLTFGLSDSARGTPLDKLQSLVGQVLGNVKSLTLDATISGTVSQPSIAISSNVGDALAGGIRQVLGEQVAKAEARVKEEVDKQISQGIAVAQQQVSAVTQDLGKKVGLQSDQINQVETELQAQLKRYTGGAGGLIKLPKF
ncbi:MAG: TIGR03545 family protein, partial [Gemmatimonadota bacterium]